ncbi:FHA domain-containing protein [Rathayibacter soli]|uniref:FHA domain-containing protein n=1 Tax=Rathayibacter soli TaxID=3144168 RepID=UPI0027E59746|nr:FHA domain-containing protein [Glaciibacter superstes]
MRPGCLWHVPTIGHDEWLFVAGASFLAAVDATDDNSGRAVIDSLWQRADDPVASVEDIVGTIPLGIDDGVRSFAIVVFGTEPVVDQGERMVTAVVRGRAVVDVFSVGGARRFASGSVQPWMLADFRSVTAVVVGGDDRPARSVVRLGSAALPLTTGIVRAQQLLWSLQPLGFASAEFTASDGVGGESAAASDARSQREASDGGGAGADHTILSARRLGPGSALDDTVLIPRPGVRDLPVLPNQSRPSSPLASAHRFRLGESAPRALTEPVVIGRRPVGGRVPSPAKTQLIAVDSPDAAVSAVHLRLEQQGDFVVVTDLHSRNGTVVRLPGGTARRLHPGEAAVVLVGTTIDIGDGNIIEIMPPKTAEQSTSPAGPKSGERA